MAEIRTRSATTMSRIQPLKKILKDQRIDLKARQLLLTTMGLSVATVHAGAWFAMAQGEYQQWQALIHKVYALLQPVRKDEAFPHKDAYELAEQANGMMPMEILFVEKLRLMIHILQAGDELMWAAVVSNHECAQEQSWISSLRTACEWLKEQIGDVSLPSQLWDLHDEAAWKSLQPYARQLKKLVKQAQLAHKSRIRTLCTLKKHGEWQKTMMQEMGWLSSEKMDTDPEEETEGVQCSQCPYHAKDNAALAVHLAKKHGHRMAVRRFVEASTCVVCKRTYHTRPRVLQHLHAGSTDCWLTLLRTFHPMSEDQARALDERDKQQQVAAHQRALRAFEKDKQWRPANPGELEVTILTRRHQTVALDQPITDQERDEWTQFGTLPTGQGGRPKTQRALQEQKLRNVIADTAKVENQLLHRATTWEKTGSHVPRPLTDGRRFVLLFFSGHRRMGDIASWIAWQGDLIPVCIDLAVHETHGDVARFGLWEALIRTGRVCAGHAGPPCETFSLARWLPNPESIFPRPLRNAAQPWGMTNRTKSEVLQAEVGTYLMVCALRLLTMIFFFGGCTSLEHPRGPNCADTQWAIWFSGFVRELLRLDRMQLMAMLQGPLGRPFAKPTRLLLGRLEDLPRSIYAAYNKAWKPTKTLGGREGKVWRTAEAKVYPTEMSRLLAHAYIRFAQRQSFQPGPDVPEDVEEALDALVGQWDPYMQGASGMQADYNPHRIIR